MQQPAMPLIELTLKEEVFLRAIKRDLQARANSNKYDELDDLISDIETYLEANLNCFYYATLDFILQDVRSIKERQEGFHLASTIPASDEVYHRFNQAPYKIAEIAQGSMPALGLSRGECYGFTFAMVDRNLSPYIAGNPPIQFNREIHQYQENQGNRERDQAKVKRTRLTGELYYPNYQQQAHAIFKKAEKHYSKELALLIRSSLNGGHACYISVQDDGIRFMDPNHGAYLFKEKQDFIDFYVSILKQAKSKGVDFRYFQLNELIWDPNNELKESKTFAGKIRSIIYGPKYLTQTAEHPFKKFFELGGLGMMIGGILGTVLFPGVGTISGGLVGMGLGMGVAAIRYTIHKGLIGIPMLLEQIWQDLRAPRSQEQVDDEQELQQDIDQTLESSSTATMLLQLPQGDGDSACLLSTREEATVENTMQETPDIPATSERSDDESSEAVSPLFR